MATLHIQKRGNAWEYRIYLGYVDGKPKRIARSGFRTKQEATTAGRLQLQEYLSPSQQSAKARGMTYGAYLDFWVDHYCQVNLKETTVYDYGKRIENVIKPRLGAYLLSALTPMILQEFINDIFNAGYSRNALSSIKGIISGSLRYAVSPAGYLESSPATVLKLPHKRAKAKLKPRKKERVPLTAEQWQRLIQRFPREHPSHIPLMLGYHLGLRLGQVFGLCWEDIDLTNGVLTVNRQVQYDDTRKCWYFTTPKYDSIRSVTMDDELVQLLSDEKSKQQQAQSYFGKRYQTTKVDADDRFAQQGRPVSLVCIRENGSYIQPRTMQHTMHVAHTELGLPLMDFHTLRHTHATMLIQLGASMLDVKERLGHTSVNITAIYTHNTEQIKARTTRLLNELFPGDKK